MMKTILAVILLLGMAVGQQLPQAPKSDKPQTQHAPNPADPAAKVWVNTTSGKYFCPGSPWYGKTKAGQYATQAEAEKQGYRPAYGQHCTK